MTATPPDEQQPSVPQPASAQAAEPTAAPADVRAEPSQLAPLQHQLLPPSRPAATMAVAPVIGYGGGPVPVAARKSGRGDLRSAVLTLLAEQPLNGYELIRHITERSNGSWRPSPGGVYPALQLLEEDEIVETTEVLGRKAYQLSDHGRNHVDENWEALAAVWNNPTPAIDERVLEINTLCEHVLTAVRQAFHGADEDRYQQVRQLLLDTRRSLYQMLADADGPV